VVRVCKELKIDFDDLDLSRYNPGVRGRKQLDRHNNIVSTTVMIKCPGRFRCDACGRWWPSGKAEFTLIRYHTAAIGNGAPKVDEIHRQECTTANCRAGGTWCFFPTLDFIKRIRFVLEIAAGRHIDTDNGDNEIKPKTTHEYGLCGVCQDYILRGKLKESPHWVPPPQE
jgi:hypothetical protein